MLKVWFVDDHLRMGRNYLATLQAGSFDIVSEYPQREVDLVVFVAQFSQELWTKAHNYLKHFPETPIIYILSQDSILESQIDSKINYKVMRPLSSKSKFLQAAKDLVAHAQLRKSVHAQFKHSEDSSQAMFQSLDLNEVVAKSLTFFGHGVACENVFWIKGPEYQQLLEADLEDDLSHKYNFSMVLRGFRDWTEKPTVDLFRQIFIQHKNAHNDLMVDNLKISTSQHQINGRTHIMLSLFHSQEDRFLCFYLFEGVERDLVDMTMQNVMGSLRHMALHIYFCHQFWHAKGESFIDELSELYNQRYLPLVLENEIHRCERQQQKFGFLFLDLDFFKQVNDAKGHWVGSKLLGQLGHLIKSVIRTSDYAFRYGGDEYVVLLANTDVDGSTIVGERLRKKIEETTFVIDGEELHVTVSIGVAVFPDHAKTVEQIVRMADQAMYCGKNKSRNIVYVAS